MKICIPVIRPDGLSSPIEADPAEARYLHFYDVELSSFEEVDLAAKDAEVVDFDALICSKLHRQVFSSLRQKGIEVFLSDAATVQDALDEFREGSLFRIPDTAGGCGGGCHGHDHDHGEGGCGCHSGGEGAHSGGGGCGGGCSGHGEQGGCCSSGGARPASARRPRASEETLRIAVTSQNRKTVTEHAGKCRKFWIYETRLGQIVEKSMLELSLEQSLHEWSSSEPHPIEAVDVLISASMGEGMQRRLSDWGVEPVVTEETDPDLAVASFLAALRS